MNDSATFLATDPATGSPTYVEGPPADCVHPADDRAPISGDGWVCGRCMQLVEGPSPPSTLPRAPVLPDATEHPALPMGPAVLPVREAEGEGQEEGR